MAKSKATETPSEGIPPKKIAEAAMVPLDKLHPGNGDGTNARHVAPDKEDDNSLLASIGTIGLILPLAVKSNGDGGHVVIDGNRRLAALHALAKSGRIKPDAMIPVIDHEDADAASALEMSLAANMERLDLHPVDRYEAFAALVEKGRTREQIGERFLLTQRQVNQVLALGGLSPAVRTAWKDGKISQEAAEVFTLAAGDFDRQDKVLTRNKHAHGVQQALIGERHETAKLLTFVGLAAYREAGGAVTEDLFTERKGEEAIATDLPLLKKLFDEKLAQRVKGIEGDGWKWVALATDLPASWSYSYERLQAKDGKWSDAQKAKAGAVLYFNHDGKFVIDYGMVKPSDKKAADKKKAAAKGEHPEAAMSNALAQRLSETLTWATAEVLEREPDIALAAVLAGFAAGGNVVDVRENGLKAKKQGPEEGDLQFAGAFKSALKHDRQARLIALASIAARALDFQVHRADDPPLADDGIAALCKALNAKALGKALRSHFDAKDYFESVSKELIYQAVDEAIGKDDVSAKVAKMKKPDAVKFALENVPKTGWLPPQLRWPGYDGPGKIPARTKS